MSGIFVSYRRASSSAVVYRLVDELKERFGDEAIFFDVESIAPGMSFAQAIQQALSKTTIALIVIGPQWVHVTDEGGKRRLENPDDWVRHEVYAALNSRARVIPLLVEGAEIPPQNLLPDNIQELANLQAFTFAKSPEYWDFDIQRLEERLRKIDRNLPRLDGKGPQPVPPAPAPEATGHFSKKVAWGLGLTAFFAFGFADPEPNSEGFYGIALFFGLALGLHLMGLADINKGLTRGRGAAILGIVASIALGALALIAGALIDSQAILQDALSTEDNQSFADTQQQDFSQDAQNNFQGDAPAQQQGLSGVTKPPFEPQQQTEFEQTEFQQQDTAVDADSDYDFADSRGPDITGNWSSNIGSSYQFGNNLNGSVFFYEYNDLQVEVGYGQGEFADGTFTFSYTNHLLQLSATVQMQMASDRGDLMQAVAYMEGLQPVNFELYRTPTAAE